jgi:hypothetical protein
MWCARSPRLGLSDLLAWQGSCCQEHLFQTERMSTAAYMLESNQQKYMVAKIQESEGQGCDLSPSAVQVYAKQLAQGQLPVPCHPINANGGRSKEPV